ncbi:MAG: flippase-like domain-containing protein [Bacteroidales bacterium]|nr:flippase-like domain-containing protein [Bacteroidales bacterium]
MKRKVINVLKNLLFLGIGLTLLWLALRGQDFELMFIELKNANYWWIGASLVPAAISHISRAARWNIMIRSLGYKTQIFNTFWAVMIGYFANLAVPRLGELTRCGVLNREQNIPMNSLIGTVISERVFDFITLALIAFLVVIFQLDFLADFLDKYVLNPLSANVSGNVTLIILYIVGVIVGGFLFLFFIKLNKERIKNLSFYEKVRNIIVGLIDGLKTIKRMDQKWAFILHTLNIWIMYFLMIYLAFPALRATSQLGIIDGLTVLTLGSVGMVAPVPAGIGAYHYIVTKTLMDVYQIASEASASFALIVHTSQNLFIVLLGSISVLVLTVTKKTPLNAKA